MYCAAVLCTIQQYHALYNSIGFWTNVHTWGYNTTMWNTVRGGGGVVIDIQRACHDFTRTLVSLTQIYLLYTRISDHRFIATTFIGHTISYQYNLFYYAHFCPLFNSSLFFISYLYIIYFIIGLYRPKPTHRPSAHVGLFFGLSWLN